MEYFSHGVIAVVAIGVPVYFGCRIAITAWKHAQGHKQDAVHSHEGRTDKPSLAQRALEDKWGDPSSDARSDLAEMEGVIRDVTVLSDFSILMGPYRATMPYWETVDMLRKLALVGLVVLVGRGSVAQVAVGTVLSFGFFALHVKVHTKLHLGCHRSSILHETKR